MNQIGKKSKKNWSVSYKRLPSDGRSKHPLYRAYASMKNRCYNKKDIEDYPLYGARGIKVCNRWLGGEGFNNFVADVGERPVGMSLDRIDNEGDYEPGNVKWSTPKEQSYNRRNNLLFEGKNVDQLVLETGKHPETIRKAIRNGRSPYVKPEPWNKGKWDHGTASGYLNHGCRCEACRMARNIARKKKSIQNVLTF